MRLRSASSRENNVQNSHVRLPNQKKKLRKSQGIKAPISKLEGNIEDHTTPNQQSRNKEHRSQTVVESDDVKEEITLDGNHTGLSTNKSPTNQSIRERLSQGLFKNKTRQAITHSMPLHLPSMPLSVSLWSKV